MALLLLMRRYPRFGFNPSGAFFVHININTAVEINISFSFQYNAYMLIAAAPGYAFISTAVSILKKYKL